MTDPRQPKPAYADFKSLRDLTYERIREAIVAGEYAGGTWLKERSLAERFGVSTTPVKEALRRLELEGLVVNVPLRGSYVAPNLDSTLSEMSVLRASLEGVAAYLAASKATDEDIQSLKAQMARMSECAGKHDVEGAIEANGTFHQMIHSIGRNTFLTQMLDIVRTFERVHRVRALADATEMERGLQDHAAVLEAIAERSPELAEVNMRAHIQRSAGLLEQQERSSEAAGASRAR